MLSWILFAIWYSYMFRMWDPMHSLWNFRKYKLFGMWDWLLFGFPHLQILCFPMQNLFLTLWLLNLHNWLLLWKWKLSSLLFRMCGLYCFRSNKLLWLQRWILPREYHLLKYLKLNIYFLECPSKCSTTCSFQDGNVVCDECASGYFGVNCEACDTNCLTCSDSTTNCLSCSVGKYLNLGTCSSCGARCVSCADITGYCTNCIDGY